ncbi:LRR receptor-like serine/threonine-protein kinase GHR1 [Mercurialis annua]|uniref:LRR receptor-like serine/threonine-protein kinase GHR1 n=1 Tax=Mercurialis annua TaxID=3986 RepID=UPI002160E52F|nr:LRR receptor-like serine/threonine-protein kinase GHR1 [Mercurialis annua]
MTSVSEVVELKPVVIVETLLLLLTVYMPGATTMLMMSSPEAMMDILRHWCRTGILTSRIMSLVATFCLSECNWKGCSIVLTLISFVIFSNGACAYTARNILYPKVGICNFGYHNQNVIHLFNDLAHFSCLKQVPLFKLHLSQVSKLNQSVSYRSCNFSKFSKYHVAFSASYSIQWHLQLLEFKKGMKHDPRVMSFNLGRRSPLILMDDRLLGMYVCKPYTACKLSMENNFLTGKLPDNIVSFRSLEFLDVSNNLFSFTLPNGFVKLGSLKNFSLVCNNFSGSIPDSFSGLVSVQFVDLSRNSFSGSLPTTMTEMNNLLYLNHSFNRLIKRIPRGFELISGLQVLDLHGNKFDGHLDGKFFLLTNVSYVDLSVNMLVSSSPEKLLLGISESIKHLNLSHNQLTGSLLADVRLCASLKILDLRYNHHSGDLPGFDFAYQLQVLRLRNNLFSGSVPNDLLKGYSSLLTELDLSANNLSGPISMILSITLRVLDLSSNGLTGELPLVTGSCAVLDRSNNQFEGNLTKIIKWGILKTLILARILQVLDLSSNQLDGPLLCVQVKKEHSLECECNILLIMEGPMCQLALDRPDVVGRLKAGRPAFLWVLTGSIQIEPVGLGFGSVFLNSSDFDYLILF